MAIRKRGGKWYYRFYVKGEEYYRSTGLAATEKNRKAALDIEAQARLSLSEQIRSRTDFNAASEQFLKDSELRSRNRVNTHKRIATSFATILPFFEGLDIHEITTARIEQYKRFRLETNQVADATLRNDLNALSSFFEWAISMELTRDNPVRRVKKPSIKDAMRINPPKDIEEARYFSVAKRNSNLYDVARLIRLLGCRPEEIMALRREHVSLSRKEVQIAGGKSKAARRMIPLDGESLKILARRVRKSSTWLFPSKRYPSRHITKLNNTHDRVCLDAGVSFVLYDLRHKFATEAVATGVDLVTLAALMGHSSISLLMKYAHPTDAHKRAAMERMKRAFPRAKEA